MRPHRRQSTRLPRGVRPRLEGKPRTPLSSRVATLVSWSPLSKNKKTKRQGSQNLAKTEQLSDSKEKSEFLGKGIASWKKEKLHLWRKEICSLGVCVEVKEETGQRTEKKRRNTHQSHVSRAKHRKQCTELQSTNSEAHVLCVSGPTS